VIDDPHDTRIDGNLDRQERKGRLTAPDKEHVLADTAPHGIDGHEGSTGWRPIGQHRLQQEELVTDEGFGLDRRHHIPYDSSHPHQI
jgi:hypothetical protein